MNQFFAATENSLSRSDSFMFGSSMPYLYFNLIAKSNIVLTRKDLKNIIAKKAIIGDMSIPNPRAGGNIFLIGYNIGSVVLYKNCTIGL